VRHALSERLEAARRLAEALSHGLLGIVVDSSLEDVRRVEEGIRQLGLAGLVERWNRGKIVVFYINLRKLRAACLYEKCGGLPRHEADRCVAECTLSKLRELRGRLESLGGGYD